MVKSRRTIVIITASVVLTAAAASVGLLAYKRAAPKTLDGIYLTTSPEARVQDAYRIARENQELIGQLPCYCGCSTRDHAAHQSVLDCFKTAHAETCPICINTVRYARTAMAQGRTVDEMRRYLRNVFDFDYKVGK